MPSNTAHSNPPASSSRPKQKHSDLEGCIWPDPDPVVSAAAASETRTEESPWLLVDDVSRQSKTRVDRVVFPWNESEVVQILQEALEEGKQIAIRGTQHSMGGHATCQDGIIVDTKYLSHIRLLSSSVPPNQIVSVGPGCTWSRVIRFLNVHGKSPKTMQSYSSFSVGGTLAVNAHGITTDTCLIQDIQSFRLVYYEYKGKNGDADDDTKCARLGQVITSVCNRPSAAALASGVLSKEEELFRLVVGGYGLFGIVTEVSLQISDNLPLLMDSMVLSLVPPMPSDNETEASRKSEFESIWEACQDPRSGAEVKLARLNIHTLETASLHIFRRASDQPESADLPLHPREMSKVSQLLYKWALPVLSEYRFAREEAMGQALDMGNSSSTIITKNELLFESALPLAKLYSPLAVVEDTFILQEYFCPRTMFSEWINQARPIYRDIHNTTKEKNSLERSTRTKGVVLLNTTIRFVEHDKLSFLNYAKNSDGMYSFVLYFRVEASAEMDCMLGQFHNRLAEMTVDLGGTFYLPYRKCYSDDLLQRAYPQVAMFATKKEEFDPMYVFSNAFFERYLLRFCSDEYARALKPPSRRTATVNIQQPVSREDFLAQLPPRSTSRVGTNSGFTCYQKLLQPNVSLRKEFEEEFLVHVFRIEDPSIVMRAIMKAVWNPMSGKKDMLSTYQALHEHFTNASSKDRSKVAVWSADAKRLWMSLRQLCRQKSELTRQTCSILYRAGLLGTVSNYVSVGDHGKIVLNLRRAGAFCEGQPPDIHVVHDFNEKSLDSVDPLCILERGSMHPVGIQVPFNYLVDDADRNLESICSGSIDLVTMNQGLHHIPPGKQLYDFLFEVHRILRPGGVFIFREHNLSEYEDDHKIVDFGHATSYEMVDLAHSIFNVVSGVSPAEESRELRAFRPINEWKKIMCSMGFTDTHLLAGEDHDPTFDLMLCFRKGSSSNTLVQHPDMERIRFTPLPTAEPPALGVLRALLAQVPSSAVSMMRGVLEWLLASSSHLLQSIQTLSEALPTSEALRYSPLLEIVTGSLKSIIDTLERGQVMFEGIKIRESVDLAGLLSMPEVFLFPPILKLMVDQAAEGEMVNERRLLKFIDLYVPSLLNEPRPGPKMAKLVAEPLHFPSPTLVDSSEFEETIQILSRSLPALMDPDVLLSSSGFTLTQQSALLGIVDGAPDLQSLSEKLSSVCDRRTWEEMKLHLLGIENDRGMQNVRSFGDMPTKLNLLCPVRNHPWHNVLKAFLKSPHVVLSGKVLRGLHWIGLSELAKLYQKCKDEAPPEQPNFALPSSEMTKATSLLSGIASLEVKRVKMIFEGEKTAYDLFDVGEILCAEFGYKSLTSSLTDITIELQRHHFQTCQKLTKEKSFRTRSSSVAKVGWLPLDLELLTRMRNSRESSRAIDSVRRKVVGIGSLGMAGKFVLKIAYKPLIPTTLGPKERESSKEICRLLTNHELIGGNIHNNDGHFTWFKLPEWMLVDIVEKLGKSLDHTPWYFFPFMEYIKLYFDVLFHESNVVADEFGFMKAYASEAFVTDLVPGAIMALIFGQLQAMSVPLAKFFPVQNDDVMAEEVILCALLPDEVLSSGVLGLTSYFRKTVDSRIREASIVMLASSAADGGSSLFKLLVPTYKTMGEVVMRLGLSLPSARVLQISGQDRVQVRTIVTDLSQDECMANLAIDHAKAKLNAIAGVDVLFNYRFPCDVQILRQQGETYETNCHMALRVHTLSLLALIREVEGLQHVCIDQIYELWNGW